MIEITPDLRRVMAAIEKADRAFNAKRYSQPAHKRERWFNDAKQKHSAALATAAMKVCWQIVNGMVARGELPGNGCDQMAQRNGIVLAANRLASAFKAAPK
jgi:hypothetical protein